MEVVLVRRLASFQHEYMFSAQQPVAHFNICSRNLKPYNAEQHMDQKPGQSLLRTSVSAMLRLWTRSWDGWSESVKQLWCMMV